MPVSNAKTSSTELSRWDLTLTRTYDAPRAMVFKAWTEAEHLKRWWGPEGFTNPVCEVDLRPGGALRIHMQAPDGTIYPMTGVYREIVPPERLVFSTSALDRTGALLFEVLMTMTLSEDRGKTTLTLHANVIGITDEAAPQYLKGMNQGWNQSLDRLAREMARA